MPNTPISRSNPQKLDKKLESLDRSHQARQNAKAVPVKLTNKPPKR
jgi:hypothetical protein